MYGKYNKENTHIYTHKIYLYEKLYISILKCEQYNLFVFIK